MLAFIKRFLLILIGFLFITLFVWFVGPYFGFNQVSPLEPVMNRVITIAAIVGIWFLWRLVKRFKARRASSQLMAAVVAQKQPEAARPSGEAVKLRERFEEAVGTLNKQGRGGHSLYDLPWYVIIGAPGSGKTTALLNSGLKFPLEQKVGKGALRGVGGTRNCDWWFTDQAIFLDTAGRYTTQDSDSTSDSAGWREFLALLKTYRARRPINGVILTFNAQDLMVQGASAREQHVEAARARLEELTSELGVQLPVYLMVTKCDLVAGFTEYFDDLSAEERTQVWGVTFDYDQSLRNEGPDVLAEEFDALMTRLNERVFARVEDSSDSRRRTRVFAFPQQMAATREALTAFVSEVFAASRPNPQVLLRGVYFTSGTQDGTPIDRLLGSIGRRFGTADAIVPSGGPGKAYFVEQLLKDVLVGESGLAGVNRRLEARKAAVQLGAYAATGVIAALALVGISVSYSRNRAFLERITPEITAFEQTRPATAASPFEMILPRLDAIKAVVDVSDGFRAETSWLMRWGLYQGRTMANAAQDAYVRELDGILLPRVGTQMRARLEQSFQEPEKLFQYLKGYLMLGEPKRLEPNYLKDLTEPEWAGIAGADSPLATALGAHFDRLLASNGTLRPLPLDGPLVGRARTAIRQTSMARMLYDSIRRGMDTPPLVLSQAASLDVDTFFRRRSGQPMSTPIPGIFTKLAFARISTEGRGRLLTLLQTEAWVLGDAGPSLTVSNEMVNQFMDLYEKDYINEWGGLVEDLQLAPIETVAQMSEALRALSSGVSPLRRFIQVVSEQTKVVELGTAPAAPTTRVGEAIKSAGEMFGDFARPAARAMGLSQTQAGAAIALQFQWAHALVAGELGKQPIDPIFKTMADMYQVLAKLGPEVGGASPETVMSNGDFRALRQSYAQQRASLPRQIQPLFMEIGEIITENVTVAVTKTVREQYEAQVQAACIAAIENRYPFATSTNAEASLANFAALFAPGGTFDKFFDEHLKEHVEPTNPLMWKPGAIGLSSGYLKQFAMARRIRDLFFQGDAKTPQVKFFLTITELDAAASRLYVKVHGNQAEHRHQQTYRWPITWPGTEQQVLVQFEATRFDPPATGGGAWALFHWVDTNVQGVADAQERVQLLIQSTYHRARITIDPERAGFSPLADVEWRNFSCRPS